MEMQIKKPRKSQQQNVNSESLNASTGTLNSLISATPNWTRDAVLGEHLWNDTTSTDSCYVDESECCKSGAKRKCSACQIICHVHCLPLIQVPCRPTFREAYIRDYRTEKTNTKHHWIKRKRQDNKCKHCGKSMQSILGFSSKEYMTVQCTWCKIGYHNKSSCFHESSLLSEPCSLGPHSDLIVPPDWIIKLSEGNNFKSSSIRRSSSFVAAPHAHNISIPQIRSSTSRPENLDYSSSQIVNSLSDHITSSIRINENGHQPPVKDNNHHHHMNHCNDTSKISFVIKSNPTNAGNLKPLLVFLNPKSGGNQAIVLMKKFQWLLNPRQVFDLSQGGPKLGLELFNHVPNLRILVCGGDGTVGWIFSTIDSMTFSTVPPVAVLPLGTGNDLARALNWGSGYIDESISKILTSVNEGRIIALDRWQVNCEPRTDLQTVQQAVPDAEDDDSGKVRPISDSLPLKIFNNYFSLGADAATALEFHESREANPEKFNSRLKNKLFYAGCGGKDLLLRSWRDLSEHITLMCDDEDLTPLIRSLKPHCILFLNIPRYGSGTLPWGNPAAEFQPQKIDDGYIEVIGLTSTTLATLQIGGHGERICQCQRIRLTTDKVIPMQMDGEPCRLVPANIEVFCSHQALVIQKLTRSPGSNAIMNEDENQLHWKTSGYEARINVSVIALKDYESMSDDVIALRQTALSFGVITAKYDADLSTIRDSIIQLNNTQVKGKNEDSNGVNITHHHSTTLHLSDSWVFIDSTTAACRFFLIDKEQEKVHFITDVCNMEDLFLIDSQLESRQVNHTMNDSLSPQQSSQHNHHNHSHHHQEEQPQQGLTPDDCESVNNQVTETQDSVLFKAEEVNAAVRNEVEQVDTSELNIKSIKIKEGSSIHSNIEDGNENNVTCIHETKLQNDSLTPNAKPENFIQIDESLKTIPYYSLLTDNEKNNSKSQKEVKQQKVTSFTERKESEKEERKEEGEEEREEEGGGGDSSVTDYRYGDEESSSRNTDSCSSRHSSSSSTGSYCSTISIHNNGNFNNNNTSQDDKTSISTMSTITMTSTPTERYTTTTDDAISNTIHSLSVHDAENRRRVSLNSHRTNSLSGSELIIRTKNETDKGRIKGDRKMKKKKNSLSSSVSSKLTTEIQIVSTDEEETRQDNKEMHKSKKHCRIIRRTETTPSDSEQLQRHLNKALLNASRKGTTEHHIQSLLKAGASIQAIDKYGRSCLHLAAKFGRDKVVEYLLKYFPTELLDLQEYEKNQTALHKAAATRRRSICENLISAGACPTITDIHGKQPSSLALEANDPQLATYLRREEILFLITNSTQKIEV
ncbi:unnamed protein product [Trichobilharzia szidati]|nr:unnamed protein product [Trichobilharzia szidati]